LTLRNTGSSIPKIDAIEVLRRIDERFERVAELLLVLTTPLLPALERTRLLGT
jgi:hypothetical protein